MRPMIATLLTSLVLLACSKADQSAPVSHRAATPRPSPVVDGGHQDQSGNTAPVDHFFDLNNRQAVEALRESDPARYIQVRQIANSCTSGSAAGPTRGIETTFGPVPVYCSSVLLTSFPAKRRVSFVLYGTHYDGLMTVGEPF